jgi:hypothetical protein
MLLEDNDEDDVVISPVAIHGEVRVAGRVPVTEEAADFGNYRTIVLTGTEDKQQILPYDKQRVRAWVVCSVGPGTVWVGSEAQCAQVRAGNTVAGGFLLPIGLPGLLVGHKDSLWLIGNGSTAATVSIVQERNHT